MAPDPAAVAATTDDAVEQELRRRGAILEAVRLAAERFLDPATSWETELPEVLAALASATGTSRVYLFENYRETDGEVWTSQRFEWSAAGVRSIADDPQLAALPLVEAGFARWVELFRRGQPVVGLRREMLPSERSQLEADETLSIAVVPIMVEGVWWGLLGFDECAYERAWSPGEVDGLRAAASTIGAAIRADRAEAERERMRVLVERRLGALSTIAANLMIDQPLTSTLDQLSRTVVDVTGAIACEVEIRDPETSSATQGGCCVPAVPSAAGEVVVLPLRALGTDVGSLRVHRPAGDVADADEVAFLRAVADQAAAAVQNSRLFAAAQGTAALEERQRLARELHDSVSQALYGIALGARTARTLADQEPARVIEPLDYVLSLAEAGLAEMRALIFELRPEALASEGLLAALDRQLRALEVRHHLAVDLLLPVDEPDVALPVKEALYRIAQEALHNVVKHARATSVELRLEDVGGELVLRIRDDGCGFESSGSFPGHLGLVSMRERAEQLGGSLQLSSAPGTGTRIEVRVPVAASAGR